MSNITNDSWGGFGVTLIDALDTMLLMGLEDEFEQSRQWIASELSFDKDWDASFFEYTIRCGRHSRGVTGGSYLGGLLAGYELSGERVLLDRAKQIGDRLFKAFDQSPSGLPYPIVNLHTGKAAEPGLRGFTAGQGRTPSWNSGRVYLSEVGSCQLEFAALSRHTGAGWAGGAEQGLGDPKYAASSQRVYEILEAMDEREHKTQDGAGGHRTGQRAAGEQWGPLLPVELQMSAKQQIAGRSEWAA